MPSTPSPAELIDQLKNPGPGMFATPAASIELSPALVLAAALLYMMLSNGEVEKSEIDQLQSVIGKNADLLRCAMDYVKSVPVEQFMADAPDAIAAPDRLCVLTNMCDAMLSDGQADPVELSLLARLTEAFGFSDEEFQPYFEVIALKNDKTVLGPFDPEKLAAHQATPHLAMAASLIYMMASDGSLGPEEIGRLQTMIGEFEGLQKVAVKFALKVKSDKFYASASRFLDEEQKVFILTNVYDIMLADGVVEAAETAVFESVRTSFGYTEEEFEPYHLAITAKNIKTFDTVSFTYARDSSLADDSDPDDVFSASSTFTMASAGNSGQSGTRPQMGSNVSRAMRANIVKVSNDFGSAKKLSRISDNSHFSAPAARDELRNGATPRADDRYQGPSFEAEPSQTTTRRPIGSGGRGQAGDPSRPRGLPRPSNMARVPGTQNSDQGLRPALAAEPELDRSSASTASRPAPLTPHRPRRPRYPSAAAHRQSASGPATAEQRPGSSAHATAAQRQSSSALASPTLEQARERLKDSHAANAAIRKELDHYDATGKLVRSPAVSSTLRSGPTNVASTTQQVGPDAAPAKTVHAIAVAAQPLTVAATAPVDMDGLAPAQESVYVEALQNVAQDKLLTAAPPAPGNKAMRPAAVAVWRLAVPVAIAASALMAGTATVMASLAGSQPAVGWSEAPSNTASLGPCLVGHALSKQSWLPRAASGCWSLPQPQSAGASLDRGVRKLAQLRFL